ncbi:hypothetical protein AYO38_01855 [bacterium SCGC AG-212-C10]|nr:hypothetical protein AYO38_01855 [bacterium SCGC AG-212-C10]
MLGVKGYSSDYIAACRARIEAGLAAYHAAVDTTQPAAKAFETSYFNAMVLLLDYAFVHRLRTVEGKDGNALNEVRVICQSLLEHGGVMTADKAIKLVPEKSVLKYAYGSEIQVSEADFGLIRDAFFAEIERKFSSGD